MIKDLSLLAEDGIIIAEHRTNLDMPDKLQGFVKVKERKYGTVVLSIYELGRIDE